MGISEARCPCRSLLRSILNQNPSPRKLLKLAQKVMFKTAKKEAPPERQLEAFFGAIPRQIPTKNKTKQMVLTSLFERDPKNGVLFAIPAHARFIVLESKFGHPNTLGISIKCIEHIYTILHHFGSMGNQCWLVFTGDHQKPGFLNGGAFYGFRNHPQYLYTIRLLIRSSKTLAPKKAVGFWRRLTTCPSSMCTHIYIYICRYVCIV